MASEFVSPVSSAGLRINDAGVSRPSNEASVKSAEGKDLSQGGKLVPVNARSGSANNRDLAAAVSELNNYVQTIQRDLEFSVDDESGRTVIKVIDSESKEVIRQIPPEDVLALARRLNEARDGNILAVKA